jgi:hypothetical protein
VVKIIHPSYTQIVMQYFKRVVSIRIQEYIIKSVLLLFVFVFLFLGTNAQVTKAVKKEGNVTANLQSGSQLLPVPQKVSFSAKKFSINSTWQLETTTAAGNAVAVESLLEGLKEKNIQLRSSVSNRSASPRIRLVVRNGAVEIGKATDTNRIALDKQAYKLALSSTGISITANASEGLYYGVQTLLQLIKSTDEKILLPEGEITDWPDLNVRMIYWDNAHHLAKKEVLKRIIRQASNYKINAFAVKLEGHFQYKSAPAIVEPYALSPEDYQELTDYAKAHFVELVPYLDAPAHVSFILKHPAYAHLRLFPNNNYQFSVTNKGTLELLKGMFSDLINANKGAHYILLSTDEAYYTGKGGDEIQAAKELGGNGKLLAKFIKEIADTLHQQGRRVLFWGEFPLTAADIPALPSHLINGVYNSGLASQFRQHGMRQFIYTATQGAEPVFPNYYPQHTKSVVMEDGSDRSSGRVGEMLTTIASAINEKKADFMGVVIAGWADAGSNPETFWLGYTTGAAIGWNHNGVTASNLSDRFYQFFYGPKARQMDKVYQLLTTQAEFYHHSWDQVNSTFRKPILGNSYGIFDTPRPAKDQALPLLPVPAVNNLALSHLWDTANAERLKLAQQYLAENNQLQELLRFNISLQAEQQHNLEILLSIAELCKQNLEMLLALKRISDHLKTASAKAAIAPGAAVASVDSALDMAAAIKVQRDATYASISELWLKDWYPLVAEAKGRKFLFDLDDIKDHQPARTIDLTYLIYRQLNYPLGKWAEEVQKVRNTFAARNKLPLRNKRLDWVNVWK